jgi:4-carboxymuconolactone decarboxylase
VVAVVEHQQNSSLAPTRTQSRTDVILLITTAEVDIELKGETSVVKRGAEQPDSGDRFKRGIDAYASQLGLEPTEVEPWFVSRFGHRFADEAINAAGGGIWVDDCLTLRERSLIVVAVLIAQGGVDNRLRGHVRWAITHGATSEELEALVTLLAVYVGYPRASVGMEVVRGEIEQLANNDE